MAERDLKPCPDREVREVGEVAPESEERGTCGEGGQVPLDMDGTRAAMDRFMEQIPNALRMLEDS